MKKMALGLIVVATALGFLTSPTRAEEKPLRPVPVASAADRAFLANLAAPQTPVGIPAPRPSGGGQEKALCTASATCWNGAVVSCEGNNSTASCTGTDSNCAAGVRGGVTCDGASTPCPACPCDLNCAEERALCVEICSPCAAITTCNLTNCTATCRCKFAGCPV